MSTEVGRKHVDWLMQANVPNFTGERYRRTFQNGVDAIEAEARCAALTELRAEVEGMPAFSWMPADGSERDTFVDGVSRKEVLAAIDRELEGALT